MSFNKSACIVIPIYKNSLDDSELLSLTQCFKVLKNYKIYFVCSHKLKLDYYKAQLDSNDSYEFFFFENLYFRDIKGYNKLLLNPEFYRRFIGYKYMLVYQLDAFVFRDELEYWCSLDLDYIGAPWIKMNLFDWFKYKPYPKELQLYHTIFGRGKYLSKVGNGGFSLRKVKSCLNNLLLFKKTATAWKANEDSFFAHYVKTFNPFFKIAHEEIALGFSFDIHPEIAYAKINKLPFGCHAWNSNVAPYNNNLDFWKKIILNSSNEMA